MRFRYKVLMINLAIVSLVLGVIGFIMTRQSFRQTLQVETDYAVEENNLLQASLEYLLLDGLENETTVRNELMAAANNTGGRLYSDTTLGLIYDEELLYCNKEAEIILPNELMDSLVLGSKGYITVKENGGYHLYVASKNTLYEKDLYFFTVRDVSGTYRLLYRQIVFFVVLICMVITLSGILLYFVSAKLTKPLEQLNTITDNIASGDYSLQADIASDDEIGMLAEKFNNMTLAISDHVDELNQMVKQREQFVADFTHEIKTPMTAIIGYADTLRSKRLNPENEKMAYDYIYSEGKRLESMSMKLFDLIYLSKNELQLSEINAGQLAKEIIKSVRPLLDKKEIRLESKVSNAVIFGEPELLKTVFINLIDNARKASEKGTTIHFHGYEKGDFFVFQVIDEGCGMDEETVKHICDEFYMADKSRSRAEGGAGLGMSLASLIVKRHGGKLDINSKLGFGTTITVTLFREPSHNPED